MEFRQAFPVAIIDEDYEGQQAAGRGMRQLAAAIEKEGFRVVAGVSYADALRLAEVFNSESCWLVSVDGAEAKEGQWDLLEQVLTAKRRRNDRLPIFLFGDERTAEMVPARVMKHANAFMQLFEDSPEFLARAIARSAELYLERLPPPMFKALMDYTMHASYSWHTPGHGGGVAFRKSPVGTLFYNFFGENTLRSDISVSVGALGSLLDHTGPIAAGERNSARIFGADETLFVVGGTSTANKIIWHAMVGRGDLVLCDRNCHKSILHSLIMTGATPIYLLPSRNGLGIIGPISKDQFTPASIAKKIAASPFAKETSGKVRAMVVTNSTYDGLCYNVDGIKKSLGDTVEVLHFDEAWFAYANFHEFYDGYHGISSSSPARAANAITFATHSTHKLLAALSQASLLHIRDGRGAIPHSRFNESYMLQASTSPFYPIIVSNDITAAMMDGPGGVALTTESINEAVAFRQTMGRVNRQFAAKKEWFFKTWNPDFIKGKGGKKVRFEEASPDQLATDQNCWVLHPKESWHGFGDLEDGYCMLDPIKVSIITPGIADKGGLEKTGIPATLVTGYLHYRGVEVEKTTDFTVLVLFSIGITKGKWGTLLNALLEFKKDYDNNAPLEQVLPGLVNDHGATYGGMGLRDLADQMFDQLKASKQTQCMAEAFSTLPEPKLSPNNAYQYLVRDEIEHVPLEELANRVLATSVVPYPPGIPMLMPGEETGPDDGPYLGYLRALQNWDKRFPGFGHDTHGVENRDGTHFIQCLKRGWDKA